MFAGIGAFVVAGVMVARNYINGDGVVLIVDRATGATPTTIPTDAASVDRSSPRSIRIGDLELDNEVRAVGVEEDGELEVPDETEVGWYKYGSAPGLPGSTVLAAHVSWNRKIGPFHQLGNLEPGAEVDVVADDGSTRVYKVVERAVYDKDELPVDRIWRTTGDETLVLITCGGSYNPNIRRYRQNIVIYAVPVAELAPDTGPA
ncbi:class F sortase [Ilumatobacter sp.]|uniref:class F sortase n=1 Tax=Ilumatobacter sp. TaxID=1967498 RepID=UPI003AF4D55F